MTKAPWIEEHVTLQQCHPYVRRQTERRWADVAVLSFMGVDLPWLKTRTSVNKVPSFSQGIGHACQGSHVALCSPIYQDKLFVACRSCPGVK